MRFFRKSDKTEDADAVVSEPRVENDIVYDENGEVLFDPAAETVDVQMSETEENEPVEPIASEPASDTDRSIGEASLGFSSAPDEAFNTSFDTALATDHPVADVTPSEPAPVEPAPVEPPLLHRRVNLGELRMDVARINSDIQSGERLYQRAQQRVENLMGFVERAEVDFSLLNRLEPENRRLKARNRVLEAESEASEHHQARLTRELEEARDALAQTKASLETSQARLTTTETQLETRNRELTMLSENLEDATLKVERAQTTTEVETRENESLREQLTELSGRLDLVTSERMELAKIVESLKIDCDDFRAQRQLAVSEVSDLRKALATAQKINSEMKTQMVALHEEIKGFKTQYEFNVISREDRITGLQDQIADLTKQLIIKEDVTRSALADVAQLRKARSAQDLERERLERLIESQQRQLDEAQAQLQRSTRNMAEMDQRYNDVAAALNVHQKRMGGEASSDLASPLAPPPPFEHEMKEPIDPTLTPENVEDMIMDYKLGLRADLG